MAKVFTGWSWNGPDKSDSRFLYGDWSRLEQGNELMQSYPAHHSTTAKRIIDGFTIRAGGTAESDLATALDRLAAHPNVGPFIGRQLIQRLVTSNPSKDYVARVAVKFNDNGEGVRGDHEDCAARDPAGSRKRATRPPRPTPRSAGCANRCSATPMRRA